MTKVTMSAIAREAGVGVATVDRVLNQRAPVRGATEQKVLAAASRLGYRHAQSRLLHPRAPPTATLRMGFLLLSTDYSLYRQLSEALREQAMPHHPAGVEPLFVTHGIDEVEQAAQSLRALATRVDVIGVVALDHPLIRHAIQAVSRQGVRVYALFSDFSSCGQAGYIGVDNQKAGRTAAWMAQHLLRRPGSVGVLLGDHRFTCQESCEISFRSGMREYGATQRVLEPLNTRESVEGGYRAAQALLEGHPDLQLIYAPCGGIEGVVRALREQAQRRVMLVCHGPVQEGELALIDGSITLMLRHNIENMAAAVVRLCTDRQSERDARYEQVILPFEIITRENM